MLSRPFLLLVLLLSTAYAAFNSPYTPDAVEPYWMDQLLQVNDGSSVPLCVSAFALAATLVLRRLGPRRPPQWAQEFDSETLVIPRQSRPSDRAAGSWGASATAGSPGMRRPSSR